MLKYSDSVQTGWFKREKVESRPVRWPDADVKPGDWVRRTRIYDGTARAGHPIGAILRVLQVADHTPADGPPRRGSIVILSDQTWEFVWNLHVVIMPEAGENGGGHGGV